MVLFVCNFLLICIFQNGYAQKEDQIVRPSAIQYTWHEQERIMFVCLDPCTWQGREYDNHSISLDRMNPKDLDTDQWCEVAKSWGAKEIPPVSDSG